MAQLSSGSLHTCRVLVTVRTLEKLTTKLDILRPLCEMARCSLKLVPRTVVASSDSVILVTGTAPSVVIAALCLSELIHVLGLGSQRLPHGPTYVFVVPARIISSVCGPNNSFLQHVEQISGATIVPASALDPPVTVNHRAIEVRYVIKGH